jgi:hypothetical protein
MSNRATRRAAERQAKLAAKASKVMTASASAGGYIDPQPSNVDFEPQDNHSEDNISDARLNANRANAQHSTGPRSKSGKAKSSMNAVKTGLTGRTVVLPTDDAEAYQQHLNRIFDHLGPATDKESALAQCIADTEWRLLRIAPLEASIYAVGRLKLADLYPEETNPANRDALIQGEIFITYRRDLSNLALQERRLRNQRQADQAELKALQQERVDKEKEEKQKRQNEIRRADKIYSNAEKCDIKFDFAEFGFDFSLAEYLAYRAKNCDYHRLTETYLDLDKFLFTYRKGQKTS